MTLDKLACVSLCVFIFAAPTELRAYGDVNVDLLAGVLSVAFGVPGILRRSQAIKLSPGTLCLLLFVIWATLSLAWTQDVDQGFGKVAKYWELLIIAGLISQYSTSASVRLSFMRAYVAGCWAGVFGILIDYFAGVEYQDNAGRYSAGTTDPNYVALGLVLGIPIALYVSTYEFTKWKRAAVLSYVPAGTAGIILTGSRGAVVALLSAGLAFGLYAAHKGHGRWLLRVALAALACLVLVYTLPENVLGRLMTIPSELTDGTLSDRRTLWDIGGALVVAHPFVGLGAGGGDRALSIAAHNIPLGLALDGGIISVVFFYGAFVLGFLGTWQHVPAQRAVWVTFCSAWAVGTLSLSWEVHKVTWFMFGLLHSPRSVYIARQWWIERRTTAGAIASGAVKRVAGFNVS